MKKLDVSLHADEPLRAGLLRVADGLIQNALDRDTDVARQTLASLQVSKGRERDAVAGMLSGFDGDGELQVEISKATNRVELDLERMESALQAARLVF